MVEGQKNATVKRVCSDIDPGNSLLLIYIIATVFLVILGWWSEGKTSEIQVKAIETIEEVKGGELLFTTEDGNSGRALRLEQRVRIAVSGITARVYVEQHFVNSYEQRVEGLYVFPLPDESGVDRMSLVIGERRIESEILEKKEARRTYEEAKRQGRKSSLLSQQRPNIFTTRVANIGPGERVVVEIEYQQTVRYDDGKFSLRFPMVVGPRYIPGTPKQTEGAERVKIRATGWALDTDQVPDASQITPPVDLEGAEPIPVQLTVDLAAGIALDRIDSLYHGVKTTEIEEGYHHIELDNRVFADRDFVLEWGPANRRIGAALFAEEHKGEHYSLLMLMAPENVVTSPLPREIIFVLDISGSMAGTSIVQAKEAVALALRRLRPSDRFNLVVFNNSSVKLFPQPKAADQGAVDTALQYVDHLQASGGTEMSQALLLALDNVEQHGRLRQVVFLTDGAVGNESSLMDLITERVGDSRLFTVGIGSAPNSFFMTRAASLGRGSHIYIGKLSEVKEKMLGLFAKLENPVLSNLEITSDSIENIEIYPPRLPDLYSGEPLVLAMRTKAEKPVLHLSGNLAGKLWQTYIETGTYGERPGIAGVWARKKIRSLMESLHLGGNGEKIKEEVIKTALKHHLVSKYTSLVAVEKQLVQESDAKEEQVKTVPIKTHLPAGWKGKFLFAGGSQTATPSVLYVISGLFMLVVAVIMIVFIRKANLLRP